jgi:Cutinase
MRAWDRSRAACGSESQSAVAPSRLEGSRRAVFSVCAVAGLAGAICFASSAQAAIVAAGWASRGRPDLPRTQAIADAATMPAECGDNAVLLFRVRGSGEENGTDRLGQWTFVAGTALIKKGWRVRDLQAEYPAPKVPITKAIAALALGPGALPAEIGIWKTYRDAASGSWQGVAAALIAAHDRCPQRRILVAGYSQGGIILRYVFRRLAESRPDILNAVRSVDLVADPTADGLVDNNLRHPPAEDGRLTSGLDTRSARSLRPGFRQWRYPPSIEKRVWQYCASYDSVCDPPGLPHKVTSIHTGYAWGAHGLTAAKRLGLAPAAPTSDGGGTVTDLPIDGSPPPPPPPPPSWAETTGGPTNTWTNYTNAGGAKGPTIPAFTTIQIACKLTGFAVANGNTWWYRIAQAPWSNAFYASADAFYNNGATSGSLVGTPYVDDAVANC